MSDSTQPRKGVGTVLPVVVVAAALSGLPAFAPVASASPDPIGGGTTTVTLNSGFVRTLKKHRVKLLALSPATLEGKVASFPVTGGSVDSLNGQGTVSQSGGLVLRSGKKSIALTNLVLDTTANALSATLGKNTSTFAAASGVSSARNGFGVNLGVEKLQLTAAAAKELNRALAPRGKRKGKGPKRASASKKRSSKRIFKANQVLGSAASSPQPSTLTIVPGGNATLTTNAATVAKLVKDKVEIAPIAPSSLTSAGPPPAYALPIGGRTITPTATAGLIQTAGGLKLSQALIPGEAETTMTLNAIYVELATKTATAQITVESKGSGPSLGSLGRSSIADVNFSAAAVTANPAARTVSVQNATATLQAVTAEVLNSVFATPYEAFTVTPAERFAGGDPLGTFSFTAQTQ